MTRGNQAVRSLAPPESSPSLSTRAYAALSTASSWEELWEAGSYYARLGDLLEEAHEYVIIAGWQLDSRVRLGTRRETLKEKVLRICAEKPAFHFYFLIWDHAYFYCLERENFQARIWEDLHPRVHFIFDNIHPYGASHHEKIVIIDGQTAFCGGADVCDERWDSPQHLYEDPRRSLDWRKEHHGPYHDAVVQVKGPVCGEVQKHLQHRWEKISSIPFPPPRRSPVSIGNGHRVYVSRTFAETPLIREVEFLFKELIEGARFRILLEGQYYWSEKINELLIQKFKQMRGQTFEFQLILASMDRLKAMTRNMIYREYELLEQLIESARENEISATIGAPYAVSEEPGRPARPIYVHSKLMLIDNRYLSIGSANLAARALRLDTEINLTLEATTVSESCHIDRIAQELRHHWQRPGIELRPFSPASAMRKIRRDKPWISRIEWKYFLDPELPWSYVSKRRIQTLYSRGSWKASLLPLSLLSVSFLFAWTLTKVFISTEPIGPQERWLILDTLVLASAWYLLVPFFWLSAAVSAHLGFATGVVISVSSLWAASLVGYFFGRIFPRIARTKIRNAASAERWGLRTFEQALRAVLDPLTSLRDKLLLQGIFSIPVPWFALCTLVILPSILYAWCYLFGKALR